ncbi:hypothetical protein [Aquitalea denitrificans]|uniref:hypothetical protein n=1 Tax=Aquitalea denitrificans TaxID=519081 RepID=UPI00135941CD|nr:hypothetical protein [Aquitalea denitrificans]
MKSIITAGIIALSSTPATAYTITHIYIKDNDIVRTNIKDVKFGSLGNTYVHLDGNTCEITYGDVFTAQQIKMSSDKQFLILFNSYIDIGQLKICNTRMEASKVTVGDLSDMNKQKGIFLSGDDYGSDWSCSTASIRKIPTGEKTSITAKPFYAQKKSERTMRKHSFSGGGSFSPDGNYLALSLPNFSCRKGSYPGVYNTRTWKKVEFTTPDVDARCDALFPNLPTPSRTLKTLCADEDVNNVFTFPIAPLGNNQTDLFIKE